MKKVLSAVALFLMLVLLSATAAASVARWLDSDKDSAYHTDHLRKHLGSQSCKVSANYVAIRQEAGGKKVVGHLEQSDAFILEEIDGQWASFVPRKIRIVSAPLSNSSLT